jgi:hypothetical protein
MKKSKRKKGSGGKAGTRPKTLEKYRAIQSRFQELYTVERQRIDDVEATLSREFFLSRHRIMLILKADLSKDPPIQRQKTKKAGTLARPSI